MIARLLKVEHNDERTEIVIHVNMLKEGWDVTNLYTIVPLRAANARTLIEQSIGRGLRLPYGKRTGVAAVDRLNIVAHDRFQEIVDEANRADSIIRMQTLVLDPDGLRDRPVTVLSPPQIDTLLGLASLAGGPTGVDATRSPRLFGNKEDEHVAQIAFHVIRGLQREPDVVPTAGHLSRPEVQAEIRSRVERQYRPPQAALDGVLQRPDIARIVERTTAAVVERTISIPRIAVVPKGDVRSRFRPFTLDLTGLNYQPVDTDLFLRLLRTNESEVLRMSGGNYVEARLEDYVVRALIDFDDVSYDEHSDLLFDLAGQVSRHLRGYLGDDEKVRNVLVAHETSIARFVHAQMLAHFDEEASEYETKVSAGYTPLQPQAYAVREGSRLELHQVPEQRRDIQHVVYGGFRRCLYDWEKFETNPKRMMAIILDRESERWFRPAKDQFQIMYVLGAVHHQYQPDFVAETAAEVLMIETKARREIESAEVVAKAGAARAWCGLATEYARRHGERSWHYVLVPHDEVAENRSLEYLVQRFGS